MSESKCGNCGDTPRVLLSVPEPLIFLCPPCAKLLAPPPRAVVEYRTYLMTARENNIQGTVTLENSGFDWRYVSPGAPADVDRRISLESLGRDGWRLIQSLPLHGSLSTVGIFERAVIR